MNTLNPFKSLMLVAFSFTLFMTSCVKDDFDTPPVKEIPVGNILTIEQLRDLHQGTPHKFTGDTSVYAVVTMDDKNGNIYRNAYVQDNTGAIVLRTLSSGGLYQGDSVRIYLKGTVLSSYNGMLQLDSVHVDNNIIKQSTGVNVAPMVISTISDIKSNMQAKLLKLENVQFVDDELGKPYADKPNLQTQNRMLEDVFGNKIIVRTSGYAAFAADTIPSGSGSLVAVLGEYSGTLQLYIRSIGEVKLDQPRLGNFTSIFEEDFETVTINQPISANGWKSITLEGGKNWIGKEYQGNKYAEMSAFQSGNASNIGWLISPSINIDGHNFVMLSFQTQFSYWTHDAVSVYISNDFDGTNVTSANWTLLNDAYVATNSDGFNNWIGSGGVNLSSYQGDVFIGFRYEGSGNSGQTSTYRVDNVKVLGL